MFNIKLIRIVSSVVFFYLEFLFCIIITMIKLSDYFILKIPNHKIIKGDGDIKYMFQLHSITEC